MLLLALSSLHDWSSLDVFAVVPILVDTTLAVGLNLSAHAETDVEASEQRRRLFWCVYSLERLRKSYLGPLYKADDQSGSASLDPAFW